MPVQLHFAKTTQGAARDTPEWGLSNSSPSSAAARCYLGTAWLLQPSEHTSARGLAPKPSPSWLRDVTGSSFAQMSPVQAVPVGKQHRAGEGSGVWRQ